MLVEPLARDRLEDNLNPVGLTFYSASTLVCVTDAMAQDGDLVLGGQAGPARLREVLTEAGFTAVRVAPRGRGQHGDRGPSVTARPDVAVARTRRPARVRARNAPIAAAGAPTDTHASASTTNR